MGKFSLRKKILLIVIGLLFFFLLFFSVFFSLININNNKILKGIFINGIDVSELTKDEATKVISEKIKEKIDNNIDIEANEFKSTSTFENLGIEYDISSSIAEAFNAGRSGNILKNNIDIIKLMINKKNIKINVTINNESLKRVISDINANLPNKVIENSYYVDGDKLIITRGKSGDIIDEKEFSEKIYEILNDIQQEKNYVYISIKNIQPDEIDIEEIYNKVHKDVKNAYYEENPFKVYSEKIGISFDKEEARKILQEQKDEYIINLIYTYPEKTINDLGIDIFRDTLSTFNTKYDPKNKDRETNLKLAAEKINGTILSPGESFSYNTIVGARTIEAGYKEAKIYSGGKVIDGIGGGICQVSTTLYNTAIGANLEITERYNHQFLTSYVEAGKDATVAYGVKDLKFINNRTYPIKIEAIVSNGIAYCTIYGIKEDVEYDIGLDVEILSEEEQEIKYENDNSLPIGKEEVKQAGSKGITSNTYKVVKLNGKIISRTLISQDTYKPLEKIILKRQI